MDDLQGGGKIPSEDGHSGIQRIDFQLFPVGNGLSLKPHPVGHIPQQQEGLIVVQQLGGVVDFPVQAPVVPDRGAFRRAASDALAVADVKKLSGIGQGFGNLVPALDELFVLIGPVVYPQHNADVCAGVEQQLPHQLQGAPAGKLKPVQHNQQGTAAGRLPEQLPHGLCHPLLLIGHLVHENQLSAVTKPVPVIAFQHLPVGDIYPAFREAAGEDPVLLAAKDIADDVQERLIAAGQLPVLKIVPGIQNAVLLLGKAGQTLQFLNGEIVAVVGHDHISLLLSQPAADTLHQLAVVFRYHGVPPQPRLPMRTLRY